MAFFQNQEVEEKNASPLVLSFVPFARSVTPMPARRIISLKGVRRFAFAAVITLTAALAVPEGLIHVLKILDDSRETAVAAWIAPIPDWLSPRRGEIHFLQARMARRTEDFVVAKQRLAWAADSGWDAAELQREQLVLLAQQQQFSEVAPHWLELLAGSGSDEPEIAHAFTLYLLQRVRISDAEKVVTAWLQDYPDDPLAHQDRGLIALARRNWPVAEQAYLTALKLDPSRIEPHRRLADAYEHMLRYEDALSHLDRVLNLAPGDLEAPLARANCLSSLGRVAEAKEQLQYFSASHPGNCDVLEALGRIELRTGDIPAAVQHLASAVQLRPEDAELRSILGRAQRAAGDLQAADENLAYREAAEKDLTRLRDLRVELGQRPANAALLTDIGEITYRWKSRKEGVEWFQRALAVDPSHERALEWLQRHNTLSP